MLTIAMCGGAPGRPLAVLPHRLEYRTNFDPVTVEVPAEHGPSAPDVRYLPSDLTDGSTIIARRTLPLRVRSKGVRVRMRVPFG